MALRLRHAYLGIAKIRRDLGHAVIGTSAVHRRQRERPAQGLGFEVVHPIELVGALSMLLAAGDLQIVRIGPLPFTQHDVDRACDGLRPGFGGRCTQNLDALDLLWRQRIHRKTRRHALTVQQNLCVAATQATHADGPAPARCALHRHTRQTLENIAQGGIALLLDLFTTDHDFGGRRLPPHFGVVVAIATNLNLTEIGHCGRGRWGLRQGNRNGQTNCRRCRKDPRQRHRRPCQRHEKRGK